MGTFEGLDCPKSFSLFWCRWGGGGAGQPRFCCCGEPSISSRPQSYVLRYGLIPSEARTFSLKDFFSL